MAADSELLTNQLPAEYDVIAPDGSEIRLLALGRHGSMCHCSLPIGSSSKAVTHQTVEELWYFVRGKGQVWRMLGDREMVVDVEPGWSLSIPTGASFQFRNTGDEPLEFVIVTMPPWPGDQEAVAMPGFW
jgi:mannose-6-phosphate isomerase-like protein (cupin superfamily)